MAISATPTAQASPRLIAGLGLLVAIAMIAAVLVAQSRAGTASKTGSYRLSDTTMLMQQVRAARSPAPSPATDRFRPGHAGLADSRRPGRETRRRSAPSWAV